MPSRLTNTFRSFVKVRWDRPRPLTCRHRRRCACHCPGQGEQAQNEETKNAQGRSVSEHAPAASEAASTAIKSWDNEHARAVVRSLDPYPEAKAAFIAAIMAQYKVEL